MPCRMIWRDMRFDGDAKIKEIDGLLQGELRHDQSFVRFAADQALDLEPFERSTNRRRLIISLSVSIFSVSPSGFRFSPDDQPANFVVSRDLQ